MKRKFDIGDKVLIQSEHSTLPMPQYLYAGQTGVVKGISELSGATKYYVAPELPLSGADEKGVAFYESEIELLRNEDQITSQFFRQASCLPGDSRDGYPNLFDSHS